MRRFRQQDLFQQRDRLDQVRHPRLMRLSNRLGGHSLQVGIGTLERLHPQAFEIQLKHGDLGGRNDCGIDLHQKIRLNFRTRGPA